MAVPDPERVLKNQPIPPGAAPGNRPVPLASSSAGKPGGARPVSNRPIPLAPKSQTALPEEDDDDEPEEEVDELREVLRNAPAWLVSTVFHMVLLIVLGLLVIRSNMPSAELDVEAGYVEDLGEQLENPDVLESAASEMQDLASESIITPKDLPLVEEPLVAPPVLTDISLASLPTAEPIVTGDTPAPGIALALSGRQVGSRQSLLKKYGGTGGTEAAVELGLAWLAKQQRSDGSWSLRGPYPNGGRGENTAAATAMALLAFQGHGETHRSGRYKTVVDKGWRALLKMQRKEGNFVGQMTEPLQVLYTHGQCMIAICELYGMTGDSSFRGPAMRAIEYAVEAQDKKKGGWRYMPAQDSDTSVTGWFMMGLQSARMAKLPVPDTTMQGIMRYLDSASIDGGRRYGYWNDASSTEAMCAEGLLCRQYLGWKHDDERLVEGASALLEKPVSYEPGAVIDVYYWYYATQVAHHMEGDIWKQWNEAMRRELPEHQTKTGPEAGSWDPEVDRWGGEGGRLFVTCLSIYNLEVYYRHLPIYSGYGAINALPPVPPAPKEADAGATDGKDDEKPAEETDAGKPAATSTDGSSGKPTAEATSDPSGR